MYNKAAYLGSCLSTIQSQSLADIEIICVDDCSTDDSVLTARDHASQDTRIVLMRTPENLGPGRARNLGLARASGEFVQFTDADDLLPPDALRTLYDLARDTGSPLVRGSLGNISPGVEGVWSADEHVMPDRRSVSFEQERKLWIPYFHVCYLYRRRFLIEHDISYPGIHSGEDPVFLAACLLSAPSISTSSAITDIYRRGASAIHEQQTFRHLMDFITHISMLKRMYLAAGCAACWYGLCERFFLEDTTLFLQNLALAEHEAQSALAAMQQIWDVIPTELRAIIQHGRA